MSDDELLTDLREVADGLDEGGLTGLASVCSRAAAEIVRLRAERDEARRVELAVHQILDRAGFTDETTEAKTDRLVKELVTAAAERETAYQDGFHDGESDAQRRLNAERDRLREALRDAVKVIDHYTVDNLSGHEARAFLAALKGDTP